MAALDFPATPSVGQIYLANSKRYVWNGVSWVNSTGTGYTGSIGFTGSASTVIGYTGSSGGVTVTDDTTTNASYYPVVATTAGGSTLKTSSTKILFNPSTGTLEATNFNSLSDANYKQDIQPIADATAILNQLNGVSFNWKDSGAHSYGVIAQELEKILPELVEESHDRLTVSYIPLIAILIESVKQQATRITELERLINK